MQGCTFCGGGPSSKAMHRVLEGVYPLQIPIHNFITIPADSG